jgi:hypothetical protein
MIWKSENASQDLTLTRCSGFFERHGHSCRYSRHMHQPGSSKEDATVDQHRNYSVDNCIENGFDELGANIWAFHSEIAHDEGS